MPARYLLDTDICIYLVKKRPVNVINRFRKLEYGEAVMSVITLGELRAGANKSNNTEAAHAAFDALEAIIPAENLPDDVPVAYGHIRSELEKQGQVIGPNDLWIAAHAVAADLTLVSNNVREFSRVAGLKTENWTDSK